MFVSHNSAVFSLARDLILEPDDVLHQSFKGEVFNLLIKTRPAVINGVKPREYSE